MLQLKSTPSLWPVPSSPPGCPRSPVAGKIGPPASQDPSLISGGSTFLLWVPLYILQKDYRGFCEGPVAVQTCLSAGVQHRLLESGSLRLAHLSNSPLRVTTYGTPPKDQSPCPVTTDPLQTESCSNSVSEPISGWVEQEVLATRSTGARSQGPGDPGLLDRVSITGMKQY